MSRKVFNIVAFWGLISFSALIISSCEKDETAVMKMYSGSGIWDLVSIETTEYDTMGNILVEDTVINPGQFVFLRSDGLAALSNYHQALFLYYQDTTFIAYKMTYKTDGIVFAIDDYGGPLDLKNVYTINKFGGNKHVWEKIYIHSSGTAPFSISKRVVITIKETNR